MLVKWCDVAAEPYIVGRAPTNVIGVSDIILHILVNIVPSFR